MNKIVTNRYLDALLKVMLLSAIIHMGILIGLSIYELSLTKLNLFDIIGLALLFPSLGNNGIYAFISFLLTLIVYVFFFFSSKKSN